MDKMLEVEFLIQKNVHLKFFFNFILFFNFT